MRIKSFALALAICGSLSTAAFASVITLGGTNLPLNTGLHSIVTSNEVTFDVAGLPAIVTSYSSVNGVETASSGACAAPPADSTKFLCVGPDVTSGTPITITLSSLINYFGFYVGSLDDYNYIDFYNGTSLKIALTGTQIATRAGIPANGNQALGYYVNVYANAGEEFDKIVLTSTSNALETDNHAFASVRTIPGSDSGVPEPGTLFTIVPAAAAFLYFRRKRA